VRREILESYLADNVKSRILQRDGTYNRVWKVQGKRKPPSGADAFNAQDFLIGLAEGKQRPETIPVVAPRQLGRGSRSPVARQLV
jgi:hypothetical protein